MQRPRIQPQHTTADTIIEYLAWGLLSFTWIIAIVNYASLPETIPVHYNLAGEVDRMGAKATLWLLPGIATVLFAGLTLLSNYPHAFNYPTRITEENARKQYTNATRMIRYVKLAVVVLCGSIVLLTIRNTSGPSANLGAWFLPVAMGVLLLPLGYFVTRSLRMK